MVLVGDHVRRNGLWLFEKGSKPALIISTFKVLAVVVVLKENYGEVPGASRSRVRIVPTTTDNRGERSCFKQADDDEICRECGAHGARSFFERRWGVESIRRVVASEGES